MQNIEPKYSYKGFMIQLQSCHESLLIDGENPILISRGPLPKELFDAIMDSGKAKFIQHSYLGC